MRERVIVNGFEPELPPEPSRARDWRSSPTVFVGAGAALITLVVVALAMQAIGPGATLWWVAVAAAAFVLARGWRLRQFTTLAYMHVKDLIKAEQFEAYRAMRRRYFVTVRENRRKRPFGRIIDEGGMHPPTLIRVAKPGDYVKLRVGPLPWPRLRDIRSVTVRWTPFVSSPSDDFFNQLTVAVAHFLCVRPGALVAHRPDLYRKRITFMLR
jgi:hypothetical protein